MAGDPPKGPYRPGRELGLLRAAMNGMYGERLPRHPGMARRHLGLGSSCGGEPAGPHTETLRDRAIGLAWVVGSTRVKGYGLRGRERQWGEGA